MKKILFVNLLLLTFLGNVFAQGFTRPGDWKRYRKEVFVSMGASGFLGDLGGRNKVGKDFSPVDLDFPATKTAFGAGYRYKIEKWFAVSGKFNYLRIQGNDALTTEQFRNNRNLNFKSNIFEVSARVELGFGSSKSGNRYGIKKTLGRRMKGVSHGVFGFVGVGGFYFNPKSLSGVKLKPLNTEGQGLPGGAKKYSNYSISIPMGILYRCTFQKVWTVGAELCWRKTFTDYIDDVSTVYYDNAALAAAYGPQSAAFADPSKGNIFGATSPDGSGNPAQRGDKNIDSYLSLEVTVGYTFKQQRRKKAKLRSKF